MLTKRFDSDFQVMLPDAVFRVSMKAPNGDLTVFRDLSAEQMETMWRMYSDLEPCGWDIRWSSDERDGD